jgi:signal transduction histidine kinase
MKKLIFLLSFIPGINSLFAQGNTNLYKGKIDSIQTLLNAQPANDTIKVKRLNDLARLCFFDLQIEKGFIAAKQAHQLSKKFNYKKGEGLYLRTMAAFHYTTDLYQYFDIKAKMVYYDINENEDNINLQFPEFFKGIIEKNNRQLTIALNYFNKNPDGEIAANILYRISRMYYYLAKPDESLLYLERALKEFKEINQEGPAVMLLLTKMFFLQKEDKIKEANEVISEANLLISKVRDKKESALLSFFMSYYYNRHGRPALGIENELKLVIQLEEMGETPLRIPILEDLAVNFGFLAMSKKSVEYYKKAIALREQIKYYDDAIRIYYNLGFELVALKEFNEAKIYFSKAIELAGSNPPIDQWDSLRYYDGIGQILMGQEKYHEALKNFFHARKIESYNVYIDTYIAQCYQKLGDIKESISYAANNYEKVISYKDQRLIVKICLLLSEVYEKSGQPMKAYVYLKKYRSIIKEQEEQDIASNSANLEIQTIIEKSQREKDLLEKQKLQKEQQNQNQRWWLISTGGALLSTVVMLFLLFRNNKNKQKANALLQQQKEQIQSTLTELKATQAQLIQSEKMASLGELTAGIAHEIQNPLNFVNNFSDVNTELIEELEQEADKGNVDEVKAIATDIKENEQKINHHGKRADAIVKGMLEHSRANTGKKELTDINGLADEYLRLSYHGLRAKDKSFNADFKTEFDESIGKVEVVPQDIGRVLLNLINNAFYAVSERRKAEGEGFKPTVLVTTTALKPPLGGLGVSISVKDNGTGIPQKVVDKIFQPFFTTKPTGQGTGLGLSLSYDIIKAHGGELKAETKENEGAEFIVELPII